MQKIQILLQHKEKVNVYSNYVRPHVSTLQCTYIDGPRADWALCIKMETVHTARAHYPQKNQHFERKTKEGRRKITKDDLKQKMEE